MKLLIAVTGASGLPLAIRFLEVLKQSEVERHLIVSAHAFLVEQHESGIPIDWDRLCEKRYHENDVAAAVSSGSYPLAGMVVIPCSMNTLANIAHGLEHNLTSRAAAVNLKQQRPLILVPRETPLSLIQIDNMRLAKLAGCTIVPPNLTFYFQPQTIAEMIDYLIGRILEILEIEHELYRRWRIDN